MSWSDTSLTGIDTNVILRYVLHDDDAQYAAAAAFLEALTPDHRGFMTEVSLVEVYWVLSRSVRLPRTQCLAILRSLIYTEALEFDDGEGVVRALALAEEGADFADALIEGTMGLFGTNETVTFDRDAAERLGWRLLAPAGAPAA
ncbi:PIN domain-containing protein [Microbacterium sp.]|uniref:PIN domain-containing protein n=1 Tax=Microbacterium sp. TaxID=51671 RepID=UPI0039E558FF